MAPTYPSSRSSCSSFPSVPLTFTHLHPFPLPHTHALSHASGSDRSTPSRSARTPRSSSRSMRTSKPSASRGTTSVWPAKKRSEPLGQLVRSEGESGKRERKRERDVRRSGSRYFVWFQLDLSSVEPYCFRVDMVVLCDCGSCSTMGGCRHMMGYVRMV